ncbi:phosphoserine phosphatase SerB [Pseudokineococcus lusitanus]|uniref:phosphoserine phosphatase n=1 Tax=Pseudokineococcus lusitanus TaxID=763993 RepID=A0A3N1HSH7_9ACTN|nr:phosphoserine phosphatase SerB [Pseudokineococcus lusitanus]ROP45473.1 phosphoserine phosphatase [Pseudokineococcus lusitanus]
MAAGAAVVDVRDDGDGVAELRVRGGRDAVRRALADAASTLPAGQEVDVAVVPAAAREGRRLVVLDVDSTLITGEVVEMLAARAGVEGEVARVTEAAMRGEVDFAGSLHRRVALLEGLPATVLDDVLAEVVPSPGAATMARSLAAAGVPVGVVSGGFAEVVEPLAASLGVPHAEANRLEVSGGHLTGRVRGDVVDAAAKERFLRALAARHDVPLAGTVAVGDGANDLDMVRAAGTGVAFCAKPVLAAAADVVLTRRDLTAVVHLVGAPLVP